MTAFTQFIPATLDITRQTRRNFIALLDDFSVEELNNIPKGFSNNLIWNFGHIVVTQQILCYKLTENSLHISDAWLEHYRKGTKPSGAANESEIIALKKEALILLDKFEKDYQSGIFKQFQTYKTSYGYTLNSLEEAVHFNSTHEALHYGYALALRKNFK
ncbi:MAG: DinB family protein [Bernardetiaceae bacterium]|nr:DinB family protein [Bernardetiaceae bacterium]